MQLETARLLVTLALHYLAPLRRLVVDARDRDRHECGDHGARESDERSRDHRYSRVHANTSSWSERNSAVQV
jgi:hypothetical protein